MAVDNPDYTFLPDSADQALHEDLLALLAKQSRMAPIPVSLAMGIIAVMSANHLPVWIVASWMAVVIGMMLLRWAVLSRLPRQTHIPAKTRLYKAIAFSAGNACTHALSLAFFPFLTDFERAIQTLILIGISSISIITTAGYRPISLAYLLPTLAPLFILWAWNPGGEIGLTNLSIALIGITYSLMQFKVSSDTFRMFLSSFENRQQLAVVNERLQGALEQAESASQAKTRFLASASHDLRQPIHTLSLFSAALKIQKLDERTREIADHMSIAQEALASQLDALLDVSRLDAGVVPVNRNTVNLGALLERLVEEFSLSAADKGLALTLTAPPNSLIDTDEVLFERIIRNLLSNAIKYTDSGSIQMEVLAVQDLYLLSIQDTGQGIEAHEQFKIFEEFYQPHNPERDRTRGLGLGLAIVKRLVDLLSIDLVLESSIGVGTTFTLTLPKINQVTDNHSASETANGLVQRHYFEDLNVLVVDDEKAIGIGMKTLLQGMGCRVDVAESTATAVSAAKRRQPDILLVDLRLRGTDNGLITIKSIRKIYPEKPAILISGDTAPDRLREAQEAGIELLHKPVLAGVLEQAISRACPP